MGIYAHHGRDGFWSNKSFRWVSAALMAVSSIALADGAVEEPKLSTVQVQATKLTPVEQAKDRLQEVAGGTSVVDGEEVAHGSTGNLQDTLSMQPGVFVQSVGNDAAKISIRGSGLNNSPGYFREGIKFMFDGLPISGPGGTPYELLGGLGVNYTEILRGANAFEYGALALGGGINFVTHTGNTSPGYRLREELGSHGYQRSIFSAGGAAEGADYYLNIDDYRNDGYRDYSFAKSRGALINLGYAFNEKLDTRLIVRFREEYHEDAGAITLAQVKKNATQASDSNRFLKFIGERRGTTWLGSKTTYTFDDDSLLEFGLTYHDYPHDNAMHGSILENNWDWHDLSLSLRYSRTDYLWGRENRSSIAVTSTQHLKGEVDLPNGYPFAAQAMARNFADFKKSFDRVIVLGNELEVFDDFWVTTGLSAINVRRKTEVNNYLASGDQTEVNIDYENWSLAPRLGFTYKFDFGLQLFGNISRSVDAPSSWQYFSYTDVVPLEEQKSNTVEFGVRGSTGRFDGSLTVYRSRVKSELLKTQISPGVFAPFNASPTIHQGVELGVNVRLWEGRSGDELVWQNAYTYSDFYFQNDNDLGNNDLPGIPKHVYQSELQYKFNGGYYVGLNVRSVSNTQADFTNSLQAPSYTLFGVRMGYDDPTDRYKLFLDLKNITDEDYVAAVDPIYDANGQDSAVFYPGEGTGAYVGFEVKF